MSIEARLEGLDKALAGLRGDIAFAVLSRKINPTKVRGWRFRLRQAEIAAKELEDELSNHIASR